MVKQDEQGTTLLSFKLVPTDPDFPFELEALLCILYVPATYPDKVTGKPWLRVTNPEMERGYQINVERGFESLIDGQSNKTLLALLNELDRMLESLLTPEKARTIKLVANRGPVPSRNAAGPTSSPVIPEHHTAAEVMQKCTVSTPAVEGPNPSYTAQQRSEAEAKRAADVRQLEARIGRQPLFSKSPDGVTFTVPIQPKSRISLPPSLQSVQSVKLVVPMFYNLEPCRVEFAEFEGGADARRVETAFLKHAQEHTDLNLMTQLNLLAVNMHTMAMMLEAVKTEPRTLAPEPPTSIAEAVPEMITFPACTNKTVQEQEGCADDRSHIKVIPRPPEWDQVTDDNDEHDDTYSDTYDSEEECSESEAGGVPVPDDLVQSGPERGVLLSFPYLELLGVELLELSTVSFTIRCDRCKEVKDVKNIRTLDVERKNVKEEECDKCGNAMSIGMEALISLLYLGIPTCAREVDQVCHRSISSRVDAREFGQGRFS